MKHDDQAVSLIDKQNDICKKTKLFSFSIKNWKSDSNDENDFLCFKNKQLYHQYKSTQIFIDILTAVFLFDSEKMIMK